MWITVKKLFELINFDLTETETESRERLVCPHTSPCTLKRARQYAAVAAPPSGTTHFAQNFTNYPSKRFQSFLSFSTTNARPSISKLLIHWLNWWRNGWKRHHETCLEWRGHAAVGPSLLSHVSRSLCLPLVHMHQNLQKPDCHWEGTCRPNDIIVWWNVFT